ncbi:MAG: MBL fold metallo-hydrolase [Thermoanaerobacteraceae bacterium]|nr:MBL fold metallo-hydrolase [Thermoanaerobacteraceae bacterium]
MLSNLEIKRYVVGLFQSNCYIITNTNSKESVVIDPGEMIPSLIDYIQANKYKLKYILLTHGHLDHIGGVEELREKTGAPVAISSYDAEMLYDPELNLSAMGYGEIKVKPADILLNDGDILYIGDIKIEVLHTPGHTPGGISFKIDNILFTGDTLFKGSIGRTDFPGGNYEEIINSIKDKLLTQDDNTIIYPGHGEVSTIGYEKIHNPFLK